MSRRSLLLILGGIAVVALLVVAGIFFARLGSSGVAGFERAEGAAVLPGLSQRIDDVNAIQVEGNDQSFRLENVGGTWRLASHDGYPARDSRVDGFLKEVSNLRATYVSEQENPPYEEYGVAEPGMLASRAVKVIFRDRSDEPLERLIVGHTFSAPGGSQLKKVFVRRGDDPRVWLADSDLQVDSDPLNWLERDIVDVPTGRVTELVTVAPQGERLAIRRSNGDLQVAEGLPPGESVQGPWVLNTMAAALEDLKFEDVQAVSNLADGQGDAWRSIVRTADGITYRIRLLGLDQVYWAMFSAEAEEAGPGAEDDVPAPAPGDAPATPAEAAERAERFNERHGGWAYRMPPHAAERLTTRPADLTE